MTDRHMAYIVTLEEDVRENDAEPIMTAPRMVKRVLSVEPMVADSVAHVAMDRARWDLGRRIAEAVQRELDKR